MDNYSQTEQNIENAKEENLFADKTSENREYFKRALAEAIEMKMREEEEQIKDIEATTTRRHRIRMNRWFREQVGGFRIPFPEVDNLYERIRSKLVVKLKINEFIEHRKKERRKK